MFHMTISPSHNHGKVVQLVYKQQQSRKFKYNYLYNFKHIATHWSLLNYLKYFKEVYELAVWIKIFHMTFSPSHNHGIVVQLVYKSQLSCKFTCNYLYNFKHIATHWSLLNYLKYFKEVYELAVWIKIFHMTFSLYHYRGIVVQLVYKSQQCRKFTCNYIYSFKHIAPTDIYLTI